MSNSGGQLVMLLLASLGGVVVAGVLRLRRPEPPSTPSYKAPSQIDPADFSSEFDSINLILFVSSSCDSCDRATKELDGYQGDVNKVVVNSEEDLRVLKRYNIDGVPTLIATTADGVVVGSSFGEISSETIAELHGDVENHQSN